ncbi:hypothetical protein Dimus_024567, partial [Dionaea muscipula]
GPCKVVGPKQWAQGVTDDASMSSPCGMEQGNSTLSMHLLQKIQLARFTSTA